MALKSQQALLDGLKEPPKFVPEVSLTLLHRMRADFTSGGVEASGGHTDHLTCFCHFLDALSRSQGLFLQQKSAEWAGSFLVYVSRRPSKWPWRVELGQLQNQEPGQSNSYNTVVSNSKQHRLSW